MPNTTANGIQIEYDTFGESGSPPILLIMGLSAQMIGWEEDFCKQLADKGLFVIRFDNRDVGLSTKFEEAGIPDIMAAMRGKDFQAPYTLEDMADDAVGLLDALGIEKAHICGASMGAMITQVIGYRHPQRVLSLIPIMGTTGDPSLPPAKPEAFEMLVTPAPEQRDAYIENAVAMWKIFWGTLEFDEETVRNRATLSYDRAFYPPGIARQHAAIIATGNRKPRLSSITAPTLVIHGSEDPLLPVEHGRDTAKAIPGAEILIVEGMGHCLPKAVWPQVVDAIANHTRKTASSSRSRDPSPEDPS
jgi:pimeloyl-ACP methyl ester carboxylesterase